MLEVIINFGGLNEVLNTSQNTIENLEYTLKAKQTIIDQHREELQNNIEGFKNILEKEKKIADTYKIYLEHEQKINDQLKIAQNAEKEKLKALEVKNQRDVIEHKNTKSK